MQDFQTEAVKEGVEASKAGSATVTLLISIFCEFLVSGKVFLGTVTTAFISPLWQTAVTFLT